MYMYVSVRFKHDQGAIQGGFNLKLSNKNINVKLSRCNKGSMQWQNARAVMLFPWGNKFFVEIQEEVWENS